jgi:hypothetical protein
MTSTVRLYRDFLKNANLFTHYNFRSYALRRIKHDFRAHQHITDQAKSLELYKNGQVQLAALKRMGNLSQLYPEADSVLEVKQRAS